MTSTFFADKNLPGWKTLLVATLCIFISTGFQNKSRQARPFCGTYEVTVTVLDATPPFQHTTVSGTGTATHLGKSLFEAESFIDHTTPIGRFTGTATLTAANGDELQTSYAGTSTPNGDGTVTIERHYTVTGGTGRFAGASGILNSYSSGTQGEPGSVSNFNHITLEGTITY